MRESLLDNVSLMRTFRSVPTVTSGTARFVVVRLLIVGFVCAKLNDASPKSKLKSRMVRNELFKIGLILILRILQRLAVRERFQDPHRDDAGSNIALLVKLSIAMDRTVRLKDVSRRRLTHDDVLQTH